MSRNEPSTTRPEPNDPKRASADDATSSGWDRDDYGFRGPSFRGGAGDDDAVVPAGAMQGGAGRDDAEEPPGSQRPDRYRASGGYFDARPPTAEPNSVTDDEVSQSLTRTDEHLHEEVCHALEGCSVDASHIEVRVMNGEVTLEGHVDDRGQLREAEDVCADIHGVKRVHNLLRVGTDDASATVQPSTRSSEPSGRS